jgi:hypothetical protein
MSDGHEGDRTACITAAQSGTLRDNDQRLQGIRRRAQAGVQADRSALHEIIEAGGTNGGRY